MANLQLEAWRDTAANVLRTLILRIDAPNAIEADGLADDLLRSLANQSPRPAGREPYVGLFGNAPLANLRQRAANGIKTFLENLTTPTLVTADTRADSLIRFLNGFSTVRPVGVYPYEGLFGYTLSTVSPAQINLWRQRAAQYLQRLISQIPDESPTEADDLADALLRALSRQPARPSGRPPYRGIVLLPDNAPFREFRRAAANGIKVFIEQINDDRLGSRDAVIDAMIRKIVTLRGINKLPDRPIDRLPYEGLFPSVSGITEAQLRQIAPNGSLSQIRQFIAPLNATFIEFDINTPLRQAHFLAQVAHESGEFNFVEEIASGDAYEGREDLCNFFPGDGRRFKGRGLIQITGRCNYRDCGNALGIDLLANPTLLTRDDLAARSAGWFWDSRQLNGWADRDDVVRVTRIINGGTTGLDDRISKLAAAKQALGIG